MAIFLIAGGLYLPVLREVGWTVVAVIATLFVAEFFALYHKKGISAERHCADRLSNGDDNIIGIHIENRFPFAVRLSVTDEIPFIFQRRDIDFRASVGKGRTKDIEYRLRPTKRGEYGFGRIRVFASTRIGLIERRFSCGSAATVRVYPSYLALRQFEFLAISNRLTELGIKKIRRPGNKTEFEQIREYVSGDDYRCINWKASARRHSLMVNTYEEEKSQQVISIIDKGRMMQHSFRGMTLLDYAINASLVLSYIAIYKEDKAGIATFCKDFDSYVPPAKLPGQMQTILESLYRQRSTFGESDFSSLCDSIRRHVNKRSLLILYTNFNGKASMERQLPYMKQLAKDNTLLVVFFIDNDLKEYMETPYSSTEDYYRHVIAEKTMAEQRQIVSLLRQNGILSILTSPEDLSVDVINKYLEIRRKS